METINLLNTMVKAGKPHAGNVAVSEKVFKSEETTTTALSGNKLPEKVKQEQAAALNQVEQTVSDLNSFVQTVQRGIQFSVHEDTGHSIITVTDKESGDVIRSFPSEKVLEMAAYLAENKAQADDATRGLLVNDSA